MLVIRFQGVRYRVVIAAICELLHTPRPRAGSGSPTMRIGTPRDLQTVARVFARLAVRAQPGQLPRIMPAAPRRNSRNGGLTYASKSANMKIGSGSAHGRGGSHAHDPA